MSRVTQAFVWVLVLLIGVAPVSVEAMEFVPAGPRAAGMGGAGVAVTTDSLATYWNPAGLAMSQSVDVRIQGTIQGIDRGNMLGTLDDISNLDQSNLTNLTQAQNLANQLNQPGNSLSLMGAGGLYFKGHFGEHAIGFNISDVATSGGFVSRPITATAGPGGQINFAGQIALRGLEARQAAVSYAYAFADKRFAIGITGKVIQGAAYSQFANVDGEDVKLIDDFGQAKITTQFGVDVGAVYRPSSWLRMAVVAKDLNQPGFTAPDGTKYELNPQVRGGVAVNPWSTLTLTADVDITANRTLVPGLKSQVLSLGAEQTILSEFLSLRVGTWKDMKDAQTPFTPTAGIGLRIYSFRLDVGGGYDFREQAALASGSISMTF
jgi:hypothetical protein